MRRRTSTTRGTRPRPTSRSSCDWYESADLANDELRSSALLFQLKALLEPPDERHTTSEKRDKERALKNCAECPALMTAFFGDIAHGQALARGMLRKNPRDETALFYLGKLDLEFRLAAARAARS